MTIKRYLFLFVAAVILFISLAQILLLQYFKSSIEQEINSRGKRVADQLVNLTIESFAKSNVHQSEEHEFIREFRRLGPKRTTSNNLYVKILQTETSSDGKYNEVIVTEFDVNNKNQLTEELLKSKNPNLSATRLQEIITAVQNIPDNIRESAVIEEGKLTVEVIPSDIPITKVKKRFLRQLDKIAEESTRSPNHSLHIPPPPPPRFWQNVERRNDNLVNRFFNMVVLIIMVTAVVSLIVVFWLSKKLSSPLTELINGFKQLEQGHLGVQVNEQGVEEIQSTIQRFNLMSSKLKTLTEAEEKLKEQQHLSEVSDVTKGLAHSLRNPIHTIGLLIEQLNQPELRPQDKTKLITLLNNKITQLDKNISALLAISSGDLDRNKNVDIHIVLQDIVLEIKQDNIKTIKDISININCPKPLLMMAAESEIRSILHTLIYNAFDAVKENNGQKGQIDILVVKAEQDIDIKISDNGIGIPEKIQPQLFQPHISSKAEGAGMGLYISRRIARLYYNGDLSVNNIIEDGSVVGVLAHCLLKDTSE